MCFWNDVGAYLAYIRNFEHGFVVECFLRFNYARQINKLCRIRIIAHMKYSSSRIFGVNGLAEMNVTGRVVYL